jgi:NitT/TauT family transport system permease protein
MPGGWMKYMSSDSLSQAAAWRRWPMQFLLGFLPFTFVAVIWTFLVHGVKISPVFLPPLEVMPGVVWRMFVKEGITQDMLVSIYRVVCGFLLAVAIATPLGMLMGYSRWTSRLLGPIMGFVRYMPVPVFIPLTILWFQSGDTQKMIVIFLGAFFQLVLMVEDAARAVPKDYYEAAIMRGAPRRHLFFRVLWPAALPQIFDSYRICIGWAWTYLVVAEIVGANTGVGYYIIKAQRYLMIPQIFAAMVLIGLLGMLTDLLFAAAHDRLFPWAERASTGQE